VPAVATTPAPVVVAPPAKEFTEAAVAPPAVPPKPSPENALVPPKPNVRRSATADAAATRGKSQSVAVGSLTVDSRPQGASVIVDGRRVGTTPMSLDDVRAGKHVIRIERDGYRIWTAGVSISAVERNRVTASLEK
jgi:hypothetical protein